MFRQTMVPRFFASGHVLGFLWLSAIAVLINPAAVFAQTSHRPEAALDDASAATALRPGDVVRLVIWREPELSGEFPVDETGVVVFPRLGPVQTAGYSSESLRAELVRAYEEHLNHSSINVVVLRRVQVLGAVRNPGLFQVDPTMNISDVIALAGGATAQGNIKKIDLIRHGQKVPGNLSPLTPIGASPVRSGDQLFVNDRSWLSRNPGIVYGAVSAILSFTLRRLW